MPLKLRHYGAIQIHILLLLLLLLSPRLLGIIRREYFRNFPNATRYNLQTENGTGNRDHFRTCIRTLNLVSNICLQTAKIRTGFSTDPIGRHHITNSRICRDICEETLPIFFTASWARVWEKYSFELYSFGDVIRLFLSLFWPVRSLSGLFYTNKWMKWWIKGQWVYRELIQVVRSLRKPFQRLLHCYYLLN